MPEEQISRTKAGSIIEGQRYSVNCIQTWGDSATLKTMTPSYGDMLVFSSHLIHGLAKTIMPIRHVYRWSFDCTSSHDRRRPSD